MAKTTTHLTPEQRVQIAELFRSCNMSELLLSVAGIVRNNVADFATADDAAKLITAAARMVR